MFQGIFVCFLFVSLNVSLVSSWHILITGYLDSFWELEFVVMLVDGL